MSLGHPVIGDSCRTSVIDRLLLRISVVQHGTGHDLRYLQINMVHCTACMLLRTLTAVKSVQGNGNAWRPGPARTHTGPECIQGRAGACARRTAVTHGGTRLAACEGARDPLCKELCAHMPRTVCTTGTGSTGSPGRARSRRMPASCERAGVGRRVAIKRDQ